VITAAAAIMIMVFASFVLGEFRVIKLFGMGLAVAILIDATIVRIVLVPATMELLGDRNWWFPRWLRWVLGGSFIAVALWICANTTWMIGEFYYKDMTRGYAKVFFFAGMVGITSFLFEVLNGTQYIVVAEGVKMAR
jgi:hypothetical protein